MDSNNYKHPKTGVIRKVIETICNSVVLKVGRRSVFKVIPFLKLESDVEDVIYCNWLVDIEKVQHLCPKGSSLIDINGKTIFSILTYKHGNFRPSILNPLKLLFPSPNQSNWRLYLTTVHNTPVQHSVLFLKNIMSSLLFTLGTRVTSDAMLTHYPLTFTHKKDGANFTTEIDSGVGSSPDLFMSCAVVQDIEIPHELIEYFGSLELATNYLCLQDFAYTEVPDAKRICKAHIDLPIDTTKITPLAVKSFTSHTLDDIIQDSTPFAFLVPRVHFRVLNEVIL